MYTIPDTREGWVESIKLLLLFFFKKDSNYPVFNYSKIRPKGELISTFGGLSSGSEPLQQLHERIINQFKGCERFITITDIVNVMNFIGCCVIAGNVRRSSEIALGDFNDEEFLKLKDYEKNPDRVEYGWASNNSSFGRSEVGSRRV